MASIGEQRYLSELAKLPRRRPDRPDCYTYGPNPYALDAVLYDPAIVWQRLHDILNEKVLRFNPYTVSDEVLLACVERARWQPWPALTQMVVFHCHDVREIKWKCRYDALFLHVGNDTQEIHISMNSLIERYSYIATLKQMHSTIGGKPITNEKIVAKMAGKDYFVSHSYPCELPNMRQLPAYRMYRLKGSPAQRAALIREKMVESKIEMLYEILVHPYCKQYLHCARNFINYEPYIRRAISVIARYPHATHH